MSNSKYSYGAILLTVAFVVKLSAGGDSAQYITFVCKNKELVDLSYNGVCVSEVLLKQLNFKSAHADAYIFNLEDHSKELVNKFAFLLMYASTNGEKPSIININDAYNDQAGSATLSMMRILDKLSFDEIVEFMLIASKLQLETKCTALIISFFVQKLMSNVQLRYYLKNPRSIGKLLGKIPKDFKNVLKDALVLHHGYLLWGCFKCLMESITLNYRNYEQFAHLVALTQVVNPPQDIEQNIYNVDERNPLSGFGNYSILANRKALMAFDTYPSYSNSIEIVWKLCDMATYEPLCGFRKRDYCISGSPFVFQTSPDQLIFFFKSNTDLDNTKQKEFIIGHLFSIEHLVRHFSFKKLFFLMLLEYAKLNKLSLNFTKGYFKETYGKLDSIVQEECMNRYGSLSKFCVII